MVTSGENAGSGPGVGLPTGSKIGKYEVVERSGTGGQAIVYKCYDRTLDRFVAAKQISPHLAEDPKFVERFRREAQILAKLGAEGTSIVTIHDLLEEPAGLFIVMEFVQGHTLETVLHDTNGPTEPKAVLQILWRLAAALHSVHAAGIIHRDLKPGNIIIAEGLRPKITDFGVAASRTGQTSMLLGTTKYMAPELFVGGDVDGRADMYSLGMVAYELLLGRPKFNQVFDEVVRDSHSEALRWMKWHSNTEVSAPALHTQNSAIPPELSAIVAKMMAKDRADRYESMEALGRAIRVSFSPRGKATGAAAGAGGPPSTRPHGPRTGAAPAGAGGGAMAEAEGDELDIHAPPATAPIPKKPMTLRTKLVLAGAGFALLLVGVLYLVILQGREGARLESAARNLYLAADANYNVGKFEDVLPLWDREVTVYPGTIWAAKAAVMSPLTRSRLAERDANTAEQWEDVAREEKAAEDQARKLQAATKDKLLADWARGILSQIEDQRANRSDLRQFRLAMSQAEEAFAAQQYGRVEEILGVVAQSGLSAQQRKQVNELRQRADRAGFDKNFGDELSKGTQLAALDDPDKAMDYEGAKAAFTRAATLLQNGGANIPQTELDARNKDLATKQDRLEKKKKYQDAVKKLALADTPQKKIQAQMDVMDARSKLGMSTDAAKTALAAAKAEGLMQQAQTAYDAAKFTEARQRAQDALKEVPNYPPAVAMIAKLDQGETRKGLIAKGDAAMAQGKPEDALTSYLAADKILSDQPLTDKIKTAEVQLMYRGAKALVADGKFDQAIEILEQVRKKMPSEATVVDAEEMRIRTTKDYRGLLAKGDKDFADGKFYEARQSYQAAYAKIGTPEAKQKVALANYSQNLKAGKDAFTAKDFDGARAYFVQAKKYVDDAGIKVDEVNEWIAKAEQAINAGAKP